MTDTADTREVIAAGRQPLLSFEHLYPIAQFLIEERGHKPLYPSEKWGFVHMDGFQCLLTHRITDEDWAAIKARFILPDTIGYAFGVIRDNLNRFEFEGVDEILSEDGMIPIEEWEARQQEQ